MDEDSSHLARIVLLFYVIISLIMCGGSVFGFTPLKEILLDEGVYQDLCPPSPVTIADDDTFSAAVASVAPCEDQLEELDGMFTLAASLFSAYLMPAGFCLRFLGPRICFLAGFFFVVMGSLGFAKADASFFTLSYVLIGTGNPLLYIAAFNFTKLYPQSSNMLLSVCIGCFGFSSVIFYIFHIIHFEYGVSSRQLFFGFSFIPIVLGCIGLFILPPDPYSVQRQKKLERLQQLKQDLHLDEEGATNDESTPLKAQSASDKITLSGSNVEVAIASTDSNGESSEEVVPLVEQSIFQQLKSPQFILQTLFFCWGMLHQNFYMATIGDQLFMMVPKTNDASSSSAALTATAILTNFAITYPVGCILAILPVGALVRNCSVATSLFVYCFANLLFSAFTLIPNVDAQWITTGIYILVRVGFFTSMSTYSSTIFGFANLSTMFGCAGCLAGLTSLLGSLLSHRALNVDHSFVPINTVLVVGAVICFGFPWTIASQKWQRQP